MFPTARDLQIVDSTLTVVGGDVVNQQNHHYHYQRTRDIWAILQSIPNFRSIYLDILSKATPGTGIWLIKGEKFRLWLEPNGDIKIFWGSGIPGAGKTLLAAIVIEYLEALCEELGPKVCVCYVFFRYSTDAEVTVRRILETFVTQTVERHPECLALVEKAYTRHLRERTEPTEAQLLTLLRQLTEGMSATFYVLDALDEAPTKIQLAIIKALASLDVKLFVTSRPLKTLEVHFPEARSLFITAHDVDLDLHIAKELAENAYLHHMIEQAGPLLREEIVSAIKRNCGGMFLHAAPQLDALHDCASAHEALQTLKVFPSKIEDVYQRTWLRISNEGGNSSALAKTVLVLVLYASRSMTVDELERAVATCPDTHQFDASRVVPWANLISMCRGLVIVEEESRLVRLVHYTAKDTLEILLHEAYPYPHSFLAAVCMSHLTKCGFQNTSINSEGEFITVLKNDPLLAYASEAWAFHARIGLDMEETKHQIIQFVGQSHAFPAFTSPDGRQDFDVLKPLHMIGLYHLPLDLFEDNYMGSPNVTTRIRQRSALLIASSSGHKDFVAQLLTKAGIQVNQLDDNGWSALTRAARFGHEGVIELLLAYIGIQVNLVTKPGCSALMLAAHQGHLGVCVLLMAHPDIQINLVDNDGWSALIWAVIFGQESVVTFLLAYPGTQVNLVTKEGCSALVLAALHGHGGVARRLLACPEIQVNLVDDEGFSALSRAAYEGHEGIVVLLLAHPEIEVNLVIENGYSALMLAALRGYHKVIERLLGRSDILVNLLSHRGWTALMLAAAHGREVVLQLLIVHPGVQLNMANSHGSTALLLAAEFGHTAATQLLLATGAFNVNAFDADGDTAIKLAAEGGHEDVVRVLLDIPSVDITIRSTKDGHTAMSVAHANGHTAIVELLRDYESRTGGARSHPETRGLQPQESADDSDSDTELYEDAEEGLWTED